MLLLFLIIQHLSCMFTLLRRRDFNKCLIKFDLEACPTVWASWPCHSICSPAYSYHLPFWALIHQGSEEQGSFCPLHSQQLRKVLPPHFHRGLSLRHGAFQRHCGSVVLSMVSQELGSRRQSPEGRGGAVQEGWLWPSFPHHLLPQCLLLVGPPPAMRINGGSLSLSSATLLCPYFLWLALPGRPAWSVLERAQWHVQI